VSFKQMLRRRHINGDPRGLATRFALGVVDVVRWPFERLFWAVETWIVWPLRERTAGWSPPGHVVGAAGLATVAVAAIAVGALLLSGDDPASEPAAAPIAATVPAPQPDQAEEPAEPELKGAPPSFGVGEGVGVTEPAAGEAAPAEGAEADESVETSDAPAGETTAATSSSSKPVPAGPAAMKVARRFAEAFVFYEVGQRPARAATVFGETTSPQLAEALAERPPRQPQSTEVPQARVVNLVPGPRAGKAYTVSVSLLRVGLTSELRLEMQKQQGAWLITDVRG
jgi:hypothetical protein